MDSPLKQRIQEDMKLALRAQDKQRLGVIRMMLAAIKDVEIGKRVELSDADIYPILSKMIKQRRDAIVQYRYAKRDDLVDQEHLEETIIQAYLPDSLTDEEIDRLISQVIEELGATSIKDMGKVMAVLTLKLQGRADIGIVSAKLKGRLSSS
ncbi:MAG: GatB/YqeY domain-containing protein [Pseudomonadota bacterium]